MNSLIPKHGHPSGFLFRVGIPQEIQPDDNSSLIKSGIAQGFVNDFTLGNNIYGLCAEYYLQEDFHLRKMPLSNEFFVLRIDEISRPGNIPVGTDRKCNNEANTNNPLVLLTSSLDEFTFFAPKNTKVKTLEIMMPRIWFFGQLNMDCSYGLLKKYMAIRKRKSTIDWSNHLFKTFFLNILSEAGREDYDADYLEKEINLLLRIFFTDIAAHLNDFRESEKVKISKEEINRLMNVRKYLDTDLPSPTFTSLTRIALMSSTSLKTKFKKMYGSTVFEYFQRMRMERARILLLTHKFSVKQIGRQLGYSNLSNFTIAFKKEFNQLPHELIK